MREGDPYGAFNFRVEINGVEVAAFAEVTGLGVDVPMVEYRTGEDSVIRRIPGIATYPNIVLKRGVIGSREMWDWLDSVVDGNAERRSGSIILLGPTREEVLRWNFYESLPTHWDGPSLDANANAVAIETLELSIEKLELG
jgi:phage tail-like protein